MNKNIDTTIFKKRYIIHKIGSRARQIIMKRPDLNIISVANQAHMSEATLKSLINGTYDSIPHLQKLIKLARALGLPPMTFYHLVSHAMGNRIEYLRIRHHMKQSDVAKKIHISYYREQAHELGTRKINRYYVQLIANLFDVSPLYLLCHTDSKKPNSHATLVSSAKLHKHMHMLAHKNSGKRNVQKTNTKPDIKSKARLCLTRKDVRDVLLDDKFPIDYYYNGKRIASGTKKVDKSFKDRLLNIVGF